jgi:hypothetical protein
MLEKNKRSWNTLLTLKKAAQASSAHWTFTGFLSPTHLFIRGTLRVTLPLSRYLFITDKLLVF